MTDHHEPTVWIEIEIQATDGVDAERIRRCIQEEFACLAANAIDVDERYNVRLRICENGMAAAEDKLNRARLMLGPDESRKLRAARVQQYRCGNG